jgi:hypothetical protein
MSAPSLHFNHRLTEVQDNISYSSLYSQFVSYLTSRLIMLCSSSFKTVPIFTLWLYDSHRPQQCKGYPENDADIQAALAFDADD